jgi:NitT/TauT family transport system ATP-binding protein
MTLKVQQLAKTYHSRSGVTNAVLPTTFEAGSGEFISLLGPSGCGKSTLLQLLAGLDTPTAGSIQLDGTWVNGPSRERGMVFQSYTLFPWLTVLENARFPLELEIHQDYSRPSSEVMNEIERVHSLLDLVGLEAFKNSYPRELSGGMKQRVAIVRALANQPKLLLMDEPFGALDAQSREEMQELMRLLHAHQKMTVFFVTHDIEEALYLSTRVLVFSARPGTIIADVAVPFGAIRDPELKFESEFIRLKRELTTLLHPVREANFDRPGLLRRIVSTPSQPM